MRTKHAAKESTALYSPSNDPTLLVTHHVPFGKHSELRKHEGKFTAARGKSSSRSGGNTPRCLSESPSPKCDILVKELDVETPRTYLIKDSFSESECNIAELLQPSPRVLPCASPVSTGNKFISELAELEWFYDGERLAGGETACSSDELDEQRFLNARKLKGKEQVVEESLGEQRAPMAFPTEEDGFADGSRCVLESPERSTEYERERDVSLPLDMPPWLQKAYKTLTVIDDDEESSERAERSAADAEASSSTKWPWKRPSEEELESRKDEHLDQGDGVQPEMMKVIFGESIRQQEEEGSSSSKVVVEEGRKEQGQQGTGWLWKMSLCASVSFVTWVLMNGARIQCRSLFPTIREREQPVKIIRRKPNKLYEVDES